MVTLEEIAAARQAIRNDIHRTPMIRSPVDGLACELHFKLELFQKTGSFKIRGVLNKLHHLSAEERKRGVLGVSSGNHAQSLAFGARLRETPATIVMPAWSDPGKVESTRNYGGEVILTDANLLETCRQVVAERNLTMVHPFDDPLIIAGAATLGIEILEDVPQPDLVLVSIGGGGLASGVATAIKLRHPSTKVVGVEPEGAAVMTKSLKLGKPATLDKVETIADGLAAPFAGEHTLAHIREFVDEIVLVSDEEIKRALGWLLEQCKVLTEPAAAAAFAPILAGKVLVPAQARVVCILCGGNINLKRLATLL